MIEILEESMQRNFIFSSLHKSFYTDVNCLPGLFPVTDFWFGIHITVPAGFELYTLLVLTYVHGSVLAVVFCAKQVILN